MRFLPVFIFLALGQASFGNDSDNAFPYFQCKVTELPNGKSQTVLLREYEENGPLLVSVNNGFRFSFRAYETGLTIVIYRNNSEFVLASTLHSPRAQTLQGERVFSSLYFDKNVFQGLENPVSVDCTALANKP